MNVVHENQPARENELGAIVLAGGERLRLRPLTRRITGRDTPKQFCPLFGTATLLDQTLHRVSLTFPERTTVTALTRNHELFYEPLLADAAPESRLVQPCNRFKYTNTGPSVGSSRCGPDMMSR